MALVQVCLMHRKLTSVAECPHCQALRDRIEELEVLLGLPHKNELRPRGLGNRMHMLLSLLMRREFVSYEEVITLLVEDRDHIDSASNNYVSIYLFKLRAWLGPGLRDCVETLWGSGVFIRHANKARVRQFIESRLPNGADDHKQPRVLTHG